MISYIQHPQSAADRFAKGEFGEFGYWAGLGQPDGAREQKLAFILLFMLQAGGRGDVCGAFQIMS